MTGVLQRGRLRRLLARVRTALQESFADDQTPEQIAGSFAIGVFLTMLPTLGVALIPMVYLAYRVEWINKVALFASGIVINPPVKWGVYAASVPIGVLLLGPIEGGTVTAISLDAGSDLLIRLVVGNLILAVIATVISYVGIRRMVIAYREHELDVVEEVVDVVIEEIDEEIEREDAEATNRPKSTTTD